MARPEGGVFRISFTEEETINALEMTDDRNLTAHTHHDEVAVKIYQRVRSYYGDFNLYETQEIQEE